MPGGLATPAPRRSVAPESAARSRPEPSTAAVAPRPALALAPAPAGRVEGPTTSERLRASFAARPEPATQALGTEAPGVVAPAAGRALAGRLTTRERVINAARAAEDAAPAAALGEVVHIDTLRERRRQRLEGAQPPPAGDLPVLADGAPGAPGPPARAPPAVEPPAAREAPAAPASPAADVQPTSLAPAAAGAGPPRAVALPPEAPAAVLPQPASTEPPAPATEPDAAGPMEDTPGPTGPAAAREPGAEPAAVEAEAGAEAAAKVEPAAVAEAAAAPAAVRNPEDEPGFQAMKQRARRAAKVTKAHQPAAEGAATAQGAALPPANDLESQAAGAQVEVMGEQEPGVFDAQAFIAAVKIAVEAATPATLEDADEFKESGALGRATAGIGTLVKGGKESSEHDIQAATEAAPDPSTAVPKPVSEMVNDETGPAPADVGAAGALPAPRPPEQTDLSAGPARVDAELAAAKVTDEQIARSNEPDFTAALDARQRARDHAASAPTDYRVGEDATLAQAREAATGDAAAQLEGMHGARAGALEAVLGDKQDTKRTHEDEHARVATEIQAIYEATKADVEAILDALDPKVDEEFERGEEAARARFESYVDDRMRAYKRARYDRLGGGLLWAKDKLFGMPDEVNEFYEQGRSGYLAAMDAVIEGIAGTVATELTAARARIVEGGAEVRAYVEALPEDLRAVGEEAQGNLEDRFEGLSSEVDAKQDALVDAVARRYVESRDALDARIEELQAANKGLVEKALDAVVGVIKTIVALGEMLLRVLAKAAAVVGDIIADPIGFLANLVEGVMRGLRRFVARIATHLRKALSEWLFGALGRAGVTLPTRLDGPGILDLVLQIIGLTYAHVRARAARIVGEPVVARMEQTVDLFKTLATTGLGALWEQVSDRLADLGDTVVGKIEEWVVERVVKGGINWILGLLNPVAAFIKACKAIYEIVTFVVERARQVMQFVDAVLDSISAIAKGDLGAAEEKVESSLSRALPLAIGFLAGLLGLGDVSEKVKSIIATVRRPVERAVDAVVVGVARTFKRTFGGVAAVARDTVEAGKAWAKAKIEAGEDWLKAKAGRAAVPDVATSAPEAAGDRAPAAGGGVDRVPLRFGRESHEVRGEIAEGLPRVAMASFDPHAVPKRMAELRKTYVAPFAAAGGPMQARATAVESDLVAIETLIDTRNAAIVRADADRQLPLMHELLVELRNELELLAVRHGLPGTGWVMPQHSAVPKGTISHRRQKGVSARLCIASWREGDPASGDPPGRKLSRFDGRRYERGHLLARALGGKGGDDNLAMISDVANREMRDYAELTARENLDARPGVSGPHYSPENVIGYDVVVVYDESKELEQYLGKELGLNAPAAFDALFAHAEGNRPVDQASVAGLLGRALTPREYDHLCELWRERFLARHLEIRMQVLQGRAVVGGFYGPIAAHR